MQLRSQCLRIQRCINQQCRLAQLGVCAAQRQRTESLVRHGLKRCRTMNRLAVTRPALSHQGQQLMTHVIAVLIGFKVTGIDHILDPRGIESLPQGRRTDVEQRTVDDTLSAGSLTRDTR